MSSSVTNIGHYGEPFIMFAECGKSSFHNATVDKINTRGFALFFSPSGYPRAIIGNKGIIYKDNRNDDDVIKYWSDILKPNDTAITTSELNEVLV